MDKLKIKIADKQFAHNPTSSFGAGDLLIPPSYFSWYRGDENINNVVVITESCFEHVDSFTEKIKIALLLEPPSIDRRGYDFVAQNEHKFDYILTHQKDLLNKSYKYKFYVFGGCWIKPEDRKIYPKTKNVSIVASAKDTTEGHKLRHEVIKKYGHLIDGIYGRGYNPLDNLLEAYKDYRYTIVIENERKDYWLTEKILNPIQCGCIPIYCGCPSVASFLGHSIIPFDNMSHLEKVLELIRLNQTDGYSYYSASQIYLQATILSSNKYLIPEDYIYLNFFKPTLNL